MRVVTDGKCFTGAGTIAIEKGVFGRVFFGENVGGIVRGLVDDVGDACTIVSCVSDDGGDFCITCVAAAGGLRSHFLSR